MVLIAYYCHAKVNTVQLDPYAKVSEASFSATSLSLGNLKTTPSIVKNTLYKCHLVDGVEDWSDSDYGDKCGRLVRCLLY